MQTIEQYSKAFAQHNVARRNLEARGIHVVNVSEAHTREYDVYLWSPVDGDVVHFHTCNNEAPMTRAIEAYSLIPQYHRTVKNLERLVKWAEADRRTVENRVAFCV